MHLKLEKAASHNLQCTQTSNTKFHFTRLSYLSAYGRQQRLRSALTYTSNLTCGDPCQQVQQDEKASIQLYRQTRNDLHEVNKERHHADVQYGQYGVRISYFEGRKGLRTIIQKCSGQKTDSIRNKVDMCSEC